MIVLIGHIQADVREFALKAAERGQNSMVARFSMIIAVVFPDFQFMSIDDGVIDGKKVPSIIMIKIAVIAFFYVSIYTVLAWFTFRKKEF